MKTILFLISIFVSLLIFILIDAIGCNTKVYQGCIIDKQYSGVQTISGVGVGSNGNAITTLSTSSEKFLLITKLQSNEIISVDCDPKIYYSKKINDKVNVIYYCGGITGFNYIAKIL